MTVSAKPTLVVVVGSGASVKAGISDTNALTRIAQRSLPVITIQGIPYAFNDIPGEPPNENTPADRFTRIDRATFLADVLDNGLRSDYGADPDFELLLHALEALEAFVATRLYPGGSRHLNVPVIGAFAELMRRYECLNDETLLRTSRFKVLREIHRHVASQSAYPLSAESVSARDQLDRIFRALGDRYRLVVIDFNYDDLIDAIKLNWEDGFTQRFEQYQCAMFSPDAWHDAVQQRSNLLMHMHGSVKYGYHPVEASAVTRKFAEPAKFDHHTLAQDSLVGRRVSGTKVEGSIADAEFIVSGYGKIEKLGYNPRPYGYYYRTAMEELPRADAILVLGYGWRDAYLNMWINEHAALRTHSRRAVVTRREGMTVGSFTMESDGIQRLVQGWHSIDNFAYAREPDSKLKSPLTISGNFCIAPEGFIMDAPDEENLLAFMCG